MRRFTAMGNAHAASKSTIRRRAHRVLSLEPLESRLALSLTLMPAPGRPARSI